MNEHDDELARYQYVNDENRKLLLEYLDTDDIIYLIDRQYRPEDFMEYLTLENFNIRNVDWYKTIKSVEDVNDKKMMELVQTMREKTSYSSFNLYCQNYSFDQLYDFYLKENEYADELDLLSDPLSVKKKIPEDKTLFNFKPKDLVKLEHIPVMNQAFKKRGVYLEKKASEQLVSLCNAATEINGKSCGNMVVTQGYTSFSDQETLYEKALLEYGLDDVKNYTDYPGQSIFQIGNVVRLVPAGVEDDENSDEILVQQKWLEENAIRFGFEFVENSQKKLSEYVLQFDPTLIDALPASNGEEEKE